MTSNIIIQTTTQMQTQGYAVNQLAENWLTFLDASEKTRQTYERAIRQFLNWLTDNDIRLENVTATDVRAYRDQLKETRKATTTNAYLMAVKQLFKWIEENGGVNPAKNVKAVKLDNRESFEKGYLTTAQCKALLNSIDTSTVGGKRDFAIISLMLTTGCRDIEIVRADIGDIQTRADFTCLYYMGKGRQTKSKFKKLAPQVEQAIRSYLHARGKTSAAEPLFVSEANRNKGQRLTTRSVSRMIKERFVSIGIDSPKITAHSLRHTAGTQNLLNGGTLEETQSLLDHRDINTTMIYVHSLNRDEREAENRLADAIFN